MTECVDCPWRLWPVRCYAAAVGSTRLCELVSARADYRALVETRTLALDPLAGPGEPIPVASTSDQFAGPGKMVSPWVAARNAMRACPHHRRPACGCHAGECVRPDKAGPTDLARCAACLGLALP